MFRRFWIQPLVDCKPEHGRFSQMLFKKVTYLLTYLLSQSDETRCNMKIVQFFKYQ